ncbi:pirin family protein [Rhizobium mesoamericanum]|uniref:Pirin domain protein n=1 Tax=Rhizobium mesoamericanum STM3625 TaxID=1211777 RepID=K0PYA7_9HYPH|nr:pirin family protein [Rhizobium mesoamericanum]CCM78943.1 Pirin domain protein [Rhizobium mesoamericanum STM3625]
MQHQSAVALAPTKVAERQVVHRNRASGHGPIARLMSPSDLGHYLKPFVFLDRVDADASIARGVNIHPHSGIATVTVLTEGNLHFDKGDWGNGVLDYGGVEWMQAGRGIWHGDEFTPGSSPRFSGFQLWVALPAALELGPAEWQFVPSRDTPAVGPARVILGTYQGCRSPARSFDGLNYLLVTLAPGAEWTYETPAGHEVGWLAVSHGALIADEPFLGGDMIAFDKSAAPIPLRAGTEGATFVLGSAVPHPHDLVLGYYSVHTSQQALDTGEKRIEEIRPSGARK